MSVTNRNLFAEGKASRGVPALPRRHGIRRAACAGSARKLRSAWRHKRSQCVRSRSRDRGSARGKGIAGFSIMWGACFIAVPCLSLAQMVECLDRAGSTPPERVRNRKTQSPAPRCSRPQVHAPRLRAACQKPAGTMSCGRSPETTSGPRRSRRGSRPRHRWTVPACLRHRNARSPRLRPCARPSIGQRRADNRYSPKRPGRRRPFGRRGTFPDKSRLRDAARDQDTDDILGREIRCAHSRNSFLSPPSQPQFLSLRFGEDSTMTPHGGLPEFQALKSFRIASIQIIRASMRL